jgi:adenylate cyclase
MNLKPLLRRWLGGPATTWRRLAAILAADAVGYSRLMAADEEETLMALDAARAIFRHHIEKNDGRVIDTAGDSVLAIFETALGAVTAARLIQQGVAAFFRSAPEDRRMTFRIAIHVADVIQKSDGTVYGNGVNIASRLEGLSQPGAVTVSRAARKAVAGAT